MVAVPMFLAVRITVQQVMLKKCGSGDMMSSPVSHIQNRNHSSSSEHIISRVQYNSAH